jgi:ribosomal peptide maturation radical SAM protein 1
VLLVSMPFGPVFWPSLGLGLLRAELDRRGIRARTRYFTIAFAERLGEQLYDRIAMSSTLTVRELAGEWIFSGALFDQGADDIERYVERILVRREGYLTAGAPVPAALRRSLCRARSLAAPFLDRCLAEIRAAPPRVLGFTSVFQQHVASIALARRVKAACPDTFIVFGGANCEGVMGAETLRQFPWIDAAVSGEGDLVFPELVARVLQGAPLDGLQGVRTQGSLARDFGAGSFPSAVPVRALDDLPYPRYDDYFDQFRASRFARGWEAGLFVETSRGCWWGERHHCTFCGLNGATMTYRSKSPARALAELTDLAARHPHADIQVVDNILDMGYMKTLLPELARRRLDFGLFYETKSNLKQEQVKLLRDAGVGTIQPGIESFSDDILARMRKGVSALQNVQVLKWCRQYGVQPLWNLMWGFPGEPPGEYEAMARLVPLLVHLPPPAGSFGLRLDRFSPHFDRAGDFGFTGVEPLPAYAHVYALPPEARANLAYYFAFSSSDPHPETYVRPLLAALERWRRVHRASDLFSIEQDDALLVCDLRSGRPNRIVALRGVDRAVHRICAAVSSEDQVVDGVRCAGDDVSAGAVLESIERFIEAGLIVRMGRRLLALAIPVGEYRPSRAALARLGALARRQGLRIRHDRSGGAPRRLTADVVSARQETPARA